MGGVVASLWGLEAVDQVGHNWLDQYGIRPRDVSSLPEVLSAPFLHFGWGHLIGNTVPLFVLGFLILLTGWRNFIGVTLASIIGSGLTIWLLAAPNTVTLGASGVVFGYLTYVLARGFYTRKGSHIAIAVIVAFFYGSILLGVLPGNDGVSWQGHLGGAIAGVLAAYWLTKASREPRRPMSAGTRR